MAGLWQEDAQTGFAIRHADVSPAKQHGDKSILDVK